MLLSQALVGSAGVATVGNVLPQAFKDVLCAGGQTSELKILNNLNGVLKPVRSKVGSRAVAIMFMASHLACVRISQKLAGGALSSCRTSSSAPS